MKKSEEGSPGSSEASGTPQRAVAGGGRNGSNGSEKRQLLRALKHEHARGRRAVEYQRFTVLVEIKRVSQQLGLVKCEYYDGTTPSFVGSLLAPISASTGQPSTWDGLAEGASRYFGIALDTREKSFREQVGGFMKRTFEEARLQDFLPWAKGLPTS